MVEGESEEVGCKLHKLLDWLFGCTHARYTWPQARYNKHGQAVGAYICCLQCGREFEYDWTNMCIIDPDKQHNIDLHILTQRQGGC